MPFGPDVSNTKLKAPEGEENYAAAALQALNKEGVVGKVLGNLPDEKGVPISRGHLQGVAIRDPYAILTTSADDGAIFVSKQSGGNYQLLERVGDLSHPGGIQTIGDHVVVPVYSNQGAEIQIYKYTDNLRLVGRRTIESPGGKAYSAGITNTLDAAGEFYLLAVGVSSEGDQFQFYRTPSNTPISDASCTFELFSSEQRPVGLDVTYPNGISLITDEGRNTYLLGFHTTGLARDKGVGEDLVDLSRLRFDDTRIALEKLGTFQASMEEGFAFRWGGSALVTSKTTIRIFACERDVQPEADNKVARINILHASSDPIRLFE